MAKFNPKDHLMKVQGNADYLETKWRLVWFRETWPHGTIETESLMLTDQRAIFRATVTAVDDEGNKRGSATGTKSCTPQEFKRGYIEKAETGAIGRALAALGFGTQFEPEFDEGEFLADAPLNANVSVQAPQRPPNAPKPATAGASTPATPQGDWDAASARMHAVGGKHGFSHEELRQLCDREEWLANKRNITTTKDAPPALMRYVADLIEKNPTNQRKWLDMQAARQAELNPDLATLPNPTTANHYTDH